MKKLFIKIYNAISNWLYGGKSLGNSRNNFGI